MLLADFNYFFNKAIYLFINKKYNIYDINLQTTDDVRVLKSTSILKPKKVVNSAIDQFGAGASKLFGAYYEVNLPLDYLHILNCVCVYKVKTRYKCYDAGNDVQFAAKRLTADSWSIVLNDFYNRPLPERPYYYIHNVNLNTYLPTNPINQTDILDGTTIGTDSRKDYTNSSAIRNYVSKYRTPEDGSIETNDTISDEWEVENFKKNNPDNIIIETIQVINKSEGESNLPRAISLNGIVNKSVVEREAGVRYGNPTNARMEIRYGSDDVFELETVFIDYIKTPQTVRLTQEQYSLTADTSLIMEFPDYVCQEIINELVHIVMENTADPRLLTHIPVSTSIANPAQQLTQPKT